MSFRSSGSSGSSGSSSSKPSIMFVLMVLLCALGWLVASLSLYELSSFFVYPSQVDMSEHVGERVRLGGIAGDIEQNGEIIRFKVTDYEQNITVVYKGILPDLFREGQGVVVEGVLQSSGELWADDVLAKHDQKYTPYDDAQEDAG